MFEQFLAFLREIAGDSGSAAAVEADSPAVAAAAILFHVMDADGVRAEAERAVLEREIASEFGADGAALTDILKAGEAAEQEAVDLYGFTSIIKRQLDEEARVAFIGMMWEIVYADGVRHEMEDNIVWRVAELIGVSSEDRVRTRRAVAGRIGGSAGKDDADTD